MRPSANALRTLALAALLGGLLAGCSDYLDRRDTISLNGGDAVATNTVTQMVDPWPRASAQRNIAFSGVRMQSAVERYRTNRVYQPKGTNTSSSYGQSSSSAPPPAPPAAAPPPAK